MRYLGPIIAWVAMAGVALYIVRHGGDILTGISVLNGLLDDSAIWFTV